MVCAHVLSNFMKLSLFLHECMADDMCFELASLWRKLDCALSYDNDDMILIKELVATFASVDLVSRNEDVPNYFQEESTQNTCNTYFNAGENI